MQITHCGTYTGRVFTPCLTHPVIQQLIDLGCHFEQGEIGHGLCVNHNLNCAPIYIELEDFGELPSAKQIVGPGLQKRMLYEPRADLKSCQLFHDTFVR